MTNIFHRLKDHISLTIKTFAGEHLHFLHKLGGPFSQRATIAVFHRVNDAVKPDGMTMSTKTFSDYCAYFKKNFDVISLTELLNRLQQGQDTSNTLVITFDDGYRDNLRQAAPILKSYGLCACFFITTDMIGTDIVPWWDKDSTAPHPYLNWDEVRELKALGFEIGAHTQTHADLGKIHGEAARKEIFGSKEALESQLGQRIELFAYPYGHPRFMSEENRELVKEAGFRCCLGYGPPPGVGSDPYRLGRLPLSAWYASSAHYGGHSLLLSMKASVAKQPKIGPRKVLHVIDALNVGGAQELVALLAKHPSQRVGMVVCVIQPTLDLQARIESYGVKVYALHRARASIRNPKGFFAYALGSVRDIIRIGRAEGADILQSHLSDAEFLCFFASFHSAFTRFCTTVHTPKLLPEQRDGGLRNIARKLLTRLVYLKADKVISVSKQTTTLLQDFGKVYPPKLITIANGVEAMEIAEHQTRLHREDFGLTQSDYLVLTVGRLTNAKGHIHLLKAMAILAQSNPQVHLLLAGDGELKQELHALCEELHLNKTVHFLGSRQDVPDLLALSDLYVSSSVFEGTSLAVMEAMAAGKTIVATSIDGNKELLEHEQTAWLVEPASDRALALGIKYLCENHNVGKELGLAAQKRCFHEYDIRKVVKKYEDAWDI